MKTWFITSIAMGFALVLTPSAMAADRAAVDLVISRAETIRLDAADLRRVLGDKKSDLAVVTERVAALESKAQALQDAFAALNSGDAALSPDQIASIDRARVATDNLSALLKAQTELLRDTDRAMRERKLLRAKADAIAKRASIVEHQMAPLRG